MSNELPTPHGRARLTLPAADGCSPVKVLGESLDMRVVAEGVESDGQAIRLGELRCDELQG